MNLQKYLLKILFLVYGFLSVAIAAVCISLNLGIKIESSLLHVSQETQLLFLAFIVFFDKIGFLWLRLK